MTKQPRHTTRLIAMTLGTGCLALCLSLGGPGGRAHAQAPAAQLSVRDRAAFLAVWPAIGRCNDGLSSVGDDLQQASDNFSAGSMDTGNLGGDASQMRADCLAAAHRVYGLRFGPGARHAAARRVKAELSAGLVDLAQGADDCARIPDAVDNEDYSGVVSLAHEGQNAWDAAAAHMRVAGSYVK